MTMFLLDEFYRDPESAWNKKERVIIDPKYIPRKGDRVYLGYNPDKLVDEVIFDYEHEFIVVKCYSW